MYIGQLTLQGSSKDLAEQLGRPLRLQTNRPHIYTSAAELAEPPHIDGPYWIVKCWHQAGLHLQSLAAGILPGSRRSHAGQDPLGPDRLAGGLEDIPAFAAVLDMPSEARDDDCRRCGIDPQKYVNSGIWIANRRPAEPFALADQICHAPDYRTGFRYEQTALNVTIERLNVPVVFLDRRENAICEPAFKMPDEPVVVHRAGGKPGGDHERIFERTIRDTQCLST